MELLLLFVFKTLDSLLSNLKTYLLLKEKTTLAAIANVLSYLFYILLMKQLMSSNNTSTIIITLIAVFLGTLGQNLFAKFEKAKVWKISITPKEEKIGEQIFETMRAANIPTRGTKYMTDDGMEVLVVDIFSETKETSIIIKDLLHPYFDKIKYNIIPIQNQF